MHRIKKKNGILVVLYEILLGYFITISDYFTQIEDMNEC